MTSMLGGSLKWGDLGILFTVPNLTLRWAKMVAGRVDTKPGEAIP
jgi:hypothetical protein